MLFFLLCNHSILMLGKNYRSQLYARNYLQMFFKYHYLQTVTKSLEERLRFSDFLFWSCLIFHLNIIITSLFFPQGKTQFQSSKIYHKQTLLLVTIGPYTKYLLIQFAELFVTFGDSYMTENSWTNTTEKK
jgi:hypothetical protein